MGANRIIAAAILTAAFVVAMPSAAQQSYPAKPIRVIIPFPPGEGPDLILRKASDEFNKSMGQPWLVENRPGGNMIIALEACARAPADGYNICLINSSGMSVNPHVMLKLPYDPDKDFKPITNMYFLVGGLFSNPSVPAANIRDFVSYARSKPGAVNYGTLGPFTTTDVFRLWLNENWKTDLVGIHYKGGAVIIPAVMSGEIQFTWIGVFNALGQVKANKVRLLAVDSPKRSSQFPDVPTLAEVGLPESPFASWHGLGAPAGTPDAVINRLNGEVSRLWSTSAFSEFLDARLVQSAVTPPEEFGAYMRKDRERIGGLVRKYNIPRQ